MVWPEDVFSIVLATVLGAGIGLERHEIRNAQPLINQGAVIAHNGIVREHRKIMQRLEYQPITDNDSEALLAIMMSSRDWQNEIEDISSAAPLAMIVKSKK